MTADGPEPTPAAEGQFQGRLTTATMGLLLVVLVIHLLKEFAVIIQPLLIAALIAYAILPVHRRLVRLGLRSGMAYAVILAALFVAFVLIGQGVYGSIASMTPERIAAIKARFGGLEDRWVTLVGGLGFKTAEFRLQHYADEITFSNENVIRGLRGAAGTFFGFLTFALIVFVYLVFLLAEKLTFPHRLGLAFGAGPAGRMMGLVQNINEAIANYIAVKTWISAVTGLMSLGVFLLFGIEFAVLWGFLVFLLNFIPYLGGLTAMAPPVALAFLSGPPWEGFAVVLLLTAIQLFTGQFVEPKLAGNRLNLSPLLILLSLAFWGYLWGVGGMILAVPLTAVCKIILDHVPETRPIGTLMSNL